MTKLACDAALAGDFGKPGDNIVIVAGIPFGASGTTNLLRIASLPEASLCWHRAAAASAEVELASPTFTRDLCRLLSYGWPQAVCAFFMRSFAP
jgi:hypothetical protein